MRNKMSLNAKRITHIYSAHSEGLKGPHTHVRARAARFAGEQSAGAVDAKMSFYIAYVRRTDSADWYANCYERDETIKGALAISPTRFLNAYSCGNLAGNQLGWAVFPWWSTSLGPKYYGTLYQIL